MTATRRSKMATKQAKRRESARSRNLCSICCCRRPRAQRSTCERCARDVQLAARRRLRRRTAAGRCARCEAPRTHGVLCKAHHERRQRHAKRSPLKERKRRQGVCITSTCEGTAIDHLKCARCRREETDKALARQRERIAAGLCRCGKRRVKIRGSSCKRCLTRRRRRNGDSGTRRSPSTCSRSGNLRQGAARSSPSGGRHSSPAGSVSARAASPPRQGSGSRRSSPQLATSWAPTSRSGTIPGPPAPAGGMGHR